MPTPRIPIPMPEIAAFCQKWKITEFSLFGSVLRDDFGPDSDVDVLVTFEANAHWTLSNWVDMEEELKVLFGREVDMLTHQGVKTMKNWIRRKSILEGTTHIYAR